MYSAWYPKKELLGFQVIGRPLDGCGDRIVTVEEQHFHARFTLVQYAAATRLSRAFLRHAGAWYEEVTMEYTSKVGYGNTPTDIGGADLGVGERAPGETLAGPGYARATALVSAYRTVSLHRDRVSTSNGEACFADGPVLAYVDTTSDDVIRRYFVAKQRLSLARMAPGEGTMTRRMAETQACNVEEHTAVARELYLLIDAPAFVSVVLCEPNDAVQVRKLAADIVAASRAYWTPRRRRLGMARA